jgi:signal transduction histidine kinase/ActR/RegA family two-component response regulator
MDEAKWLRRLEREKRARKEAEHLLENKSLELWHANQGLEETVRERTISLQNALDAAKDANRAKDEFLSNISHEIRTPLNAIIGFVDIMIMQRLDADKAERYLKIMKQSGQNLLSIINDILDFSKIQSGKFNIDIKESNIKDALKNSCMLYKSQSSAKSIKYKYQISENLPNTLMCDETRIVQIVNNFISNAIKFTPIGGEVNVSCDYDINNSLFRVIIKDTGVGIEKEKQKKIFSPFEQEDASTTREFGGTGLGLAISSSLINMMGGELIFESEKGKGSTFGFELHLDIPESSKEIIQEDEDDVILNGHILVAEDNPANQVLIGAVLEEFGLSFDMVENGFDAIEKTRENIYSMILMDYNMPRLSGLEATKAIREFNKEIPIIALSASVQQKDIENFLNSGMNDTIPKPIDINVMNITIQKYLK